MLVTDQYGRGRHHGARHSSGVLLAAAAAVSCMGAAGLTLIGTDGWIARTVGERLETVATRWQVASGIKPIVSGDESYWLKQHPDLLPAMFDENNTSFAVGDRLTIGGGNGKSLKTFEVVEITPLTLNAATTTPAPRLLRLVTAKEVQADGRGSTLRFVINSDGAHQAAIGTTTTPKAVSLNKAL